MKRLFVSLLLLFIIMALYAEVPQNVRATAISDDGFTLRWDSMNGVESYDIEVLKLEDRFFTNFDSTTALPDGWNMDGSYTEVIDFSNFPTYVFSPYHVFRLYNSVNSCLKIPLSSVTNNTDDIVILSYWVRTYETNNGFSFKLLTSICNENDEKLQGYELWAHTGDTSAFRTEYKFFSFPFETIDASYLKLSYSEFPRGQASFIDDVSIKAVDWETSTKVFAWTSNFHLCRINNIEPGTSYIARVKQSSVGWETSSWVMVTTHAEDPAYGASTAAAGTPAYIELSAADIPQSISILPSGVSEADYQVQLSGESNSFTYTITTDDASALCGSYTIRHPGHRSENVVVSGAESAQIISSNDCTNITISSLTRNVALSISMDLDADTLPVVLKYFYAHSISAGTCRLDWRAESESNLLGYYVLRSADASLDGAEQVSPLIPAVNSSQPHSYSYTDKSPRYPANYFLLSLHMDGSEHYSDPVFVDYHGQEQHYSDVYQNGFTIYPNPFNQKTNLMLVSEEEQDIHICLYDVRGRLVSSKDLGVFVEGVHHIPFFATDSRGRSLPSGAYLLEVKFHDETILGKIMLSK